MSRRIPRPKPATDSVRVRPETKAAIVHIAAELQLKEGKPVTLTEVMARAISHYQKALENDELS